MYRRKELVCIILVQAALTLVLSYAKPIPSERSQLQYNFDATQPNSYSSHH